LEVCSETHHLLHYSFLLRFSRWMRQTLRFGQQAEQEPGWQSARGRTQSPQQGGRRKDHLDLAGRISKPIAETAPRLQRPALFTAKHIIPFQNVLDKYASFQ
jgi:hypothetical protein